MKSSSDPREPERDPSIERALRAIYGEPARLDAERLEALRARLLGAARRELARRAVRPSWWSCLYLWTRPALPIGLAGGLVLVAALYAFDPTREISSTSSPPATYEEVSEDDEWVASAATDDPAAALLAAETRADFLAAVLDYPAIATPE